MTSGEGSDAIWSEEDEQFSESEDDLEDLAQDRTFDAVVVATDWTTETLLGHIRRGNVELDPEFQRRDAWDRRKKSRFIESLIVGLPVPQVVLAERKGQRGKFIILDGKQRLLTLQQFGSDSSTFRLAGLELRDDLNRKTYDSLPESDRLALDTQTIRTVVVRNWQRDEFLYIVFLRLNTGNVPLSPQELRQALQPGPFVRFVNVYTADHSEFHRLFRRDHPDFRMRDVEMLVRYFAFMHFLPSYVGNLKPLLDEACEELNAAWETRQDEIESDAEECRQSIAAAYTIFGENAFCRWNVNKYERAFNRAVFDVITFYARYPAIREEMLSVPGAVEETFKRTCSDVVFVEAITRTTKSREAIFDRLTIWGEALAQTIGLPLPLPELGPDGRIAYTSVQ